MSMTADFVIAMRDCDFFQYYVKRKCVRNGDVNPVSRGIRYGPAIYDTFLFQLLTDFLVNVSELWLPSN